MTGSAPATRPAALGRLIANVLRIGTLGAIAVIAVGYAVAWLTGAAPPAGERLVDAVGAGGPDAVTALGLLALTLIPLAMLGVAVVAFHRAGERRMTVISLIVTGLVVASLAASALIGSAS